MTFKKGNSITFLNYFALSLVFFCVLIQTASAQQKSKNVLIKGLIINLQNEPVSDAFIQIAPGNKRMLTDKNGLFSVQLTEEKQYQIFIKATGYQNLSTNFSAVNMQENGQPIAWQLQDSTGELSDVKVNSLNQKQKLATAPIKAQIVDLKAAEGQSVSLIELLNRSAGVKIRTTGGLGASNQILLNGFQNKAVRFFKDGIPTDYLGAAFDLGAVPVNLLDHVEIYKGVVPVFLGADALGGAVNLVSKDVNHSLLNASYQFGSFNTHRATVNGVYYSPKGHFFAGINAYMNYSDNNYKVEVPVTDNETGITSEINTNIFHGKYNSYYGEAFAGFKDLNWADLVKLSITGYNIHRDFPFGATMDKAFGKAKGLQNSLIGSLLYKKSFLDHRLNWEQFFVASRLNSHTVDTAGGHYDWYGNFTANPSEFGELSDMGSLAKLHYDYLLSRTGLAYKISGTQKLSANVVFNQFKRKGADPMGYEFKAGGDVLEVPATYKKLIAGLSLESDLLPNRLQNNLIGKFYHYTTDATDADYYGNPVNTQNSRSAWGIADGIKVTLNNYSFINLSVETALRLPEQDELFGDGHLKLSNFDLQPERSFNLNLGYKIIKPQKWSLEVNGFFRHTNHLILLMPLNLIYSQSQNVDEVKGKGIDADLGVFITQWLQATGNFTYQDLRLKNTGYSATEGARLKNTPYFFANTGLHGSWHNFLKKADFLTAYWLFGYVREYYLSYIPKSVEPDGFLGLFGRARIDARNIIPDQQIHTIGLGYEPAHSPFKLGLEVKDLFDTQIFDQFKIQNPGRSFSIKVSYSL
ncbi:Outer membrane receptor proteins, mostly Fe transport [Arachidicoccus rhizosphaerae]|uniref:Outer membrane receptor proteins, mostly Fe transport n=1 Tax=Arachidicoccus rhizosphaerae TaxID=551991 RepID=A0A1H4BDX2_9BACT|nr:TonB-dependent receptor plug domain-containing protein [Arachidicoccus rhizosphaerae]SEA46363.1 Outer membrane receptor proteins, mostly Fe transport [Arachidicoccus rhizosphaerae]